MFHFARSKFPLGATTDYSARPKELQTCESSDIRINTIFNFTAPLGVSFCKVYISPGCNNPSNLIGRFWNSQNLNLNLNLDPDLDLDLNLNLNGMRHGGYLFYGTSTVLYVLYCAVW